MQNNTTLDRPAYLSKAGNDSYDKIMEFLKENNLTDTGGCRAFYSPKEWEERGEEYGKDAELIVVHDGGDHAAAFSYDYECYPMIEAMVEALNPLGLYTEQCTTWYSAVYKA